MYTADRTEEQVLVMHAQRGEQDAFQVLVERYQRLIYTLALRMTGSREHAQDVCQETLLSAWRGLPNFYLDCAFSTWLYKLTMHTALDLSGRGKKDQNQVSPNEWGEGLQRGISALTENHRQILLLREVTGLDYSEIGSILDLTAGTVKSRLARARLELRDRLTAQGDYFAPAGDPEGGKGTGGCEAYTGLISACLDGVLTQEERRDLDRHLADCPDCRRTWDQFSAVEADLMELEAPPADLTGRVMAAAAREKQEIPFTNLPQNRTPNANARTHLSAWWRPIRNWGLAALCCVVVIGIGCRLVSTGWFTQTSHESSSQSASDTEEEALFLTLDGVQYQPGATVDQLPEGYAAAGTLDPDMAGETGLSGAAYAQNGTEETIYVALPEGGWQQWEPSK